MSNYVVGLINNTGTCKTYCYTSLESARQQLKTWEKYFRCNNVVKYSTTIIDRDCHEEIESIKIVFTINTNSEYIMFLSKSGLTREV